jgi:hypothetical protein
LNLSKTYDIKALRFPIEANPIEAKGQKGKIFPSRQIRLKLQETIRQSEQFTRSNDLAKKYAK